MSLLTDTSTVWPADLQARVGELEDSIKQLESRIAECENAVLETGAAAIIYDPQSFSILRANARAEELYGYTPQQWKELKIPDLFVPGSESAGVDLLAELRKPVNAIGPFRHFSAQGGQVAVSLILFRFQTRGFDARVLTVQEQAIDYGAQEALRASEERYRELFENANDVIFVYDLKGSLVAVNRAAEALTGYARTEILGRSFDALVAPEARGQAHDSIPAHLGGSAPRHYELPIVSKHGTRRFLEVSTRVVYRRGHPVAIQGIGRDITERKLAQEQLLQFARELQTKNEELSTALKLAREATQIKEQFLANTSHELRTPMNGIMGMIDLLKLTRLTPDQQEYAEAISQCADDLLTIINDLLDLSQIEAGRFSLADEPFDIKESVRAVVKLLKVKAMSKGLTVTFDIDRLVPQCVSGDCVRFRQILTNLIANAIKFTGSGGVHVNLRLADRAPQVRCEVIDSGIGVAESVRERIFEAFFQADGTTRRRYGGTGLGLAISKQLVDILGGQIGTFNNNPGPGATFWFELPLRVVTFRTTKSHPCCPS